MRAHLLAMRAAGVIAGPTGRRGGASSKAGIPVIEVDRRLAKVACDAVVLDNERGGREATDICWSWGTRGSRSSSPIRLDERRGPPPRLRRAHVAHGADLDERLILPLAFHARDAEGADRRAARRSGGRRPSSRRTTSSRSTRGGAPGGAASAAARHLARGLRRRRLDGDGRPGHHRGRGPRSRWGGAPRALPAPGRRSGAHAAGVDRDAGPTLVVRGSTAPPAWRRILSIPLTNPLASRLCVWLRSHTRTDFGGRSLSPWRTHMVTRWRRTALLVVGVASCVVLAATSASAKVSESAESTRRRPGRHSPSTAWAVATTSPSPARPRQPRDRARRRQRQQPGQRVQRPGLPRPARGAAHPGPRLHVLGQGRHVRGAPCSSRWRTVAAEKIDKKMYRKAALARSRTRSALRAAGVHEPDHRS